MALHQLESFCAAQQTDRNGVRNRGSNSSIVVLDTSSLRRPPIGLIQKADYNAALLTS